LRAPIIGIHMGVIARARGSKYVPYSSRVTVKGEPGGPYPPAKKRRKKGKGRGWHGDSAGHRAAAQKRKMGRRARRMMRRR